ncbi:MAG: hypothetical protein M3Y88_02230 [Chloroflexota bacterium]|nr:hypothetical protein [Chloroflexota bacterium]
MLDRPKPDAMTATAPPGSDLAEPRRRGSLVAGALWMFVLSLLLGWLPIIGPAIAGVVGGLQVGAPGPAVMVAILPALLAALAVWLIGSALHLSVLGILIGAGVFLVVVVHTVPLLLGAWLGGSISRRRTIG